MFTMIKNNRSLTFYQPTEALRPSRISSSHAGGIASAALANIGFATTTVTNELNSQITLYHSQISEYNAQLSKFLTVLGNERAGLFQKLNERLAQNPSYDGMRGDGVSLAWDYEAADIKMGGSGFADLSPAEQEELLQKRPDIVNRKSSGGVRNMEGHHINSVDKNPELQADPDNIVMLTEERGDKGGIHEHIDAHDGKWQNPTEGDLINKDAGLKNTNTKRIETKNEEIGSRKRSIFKNELRGLGIAVAIGAGIGMTISFIVTLAQSGVTPESLKLATIESSKVGIESGSLAAVGYGVGRTIGEVASKAFSRLLENIGVNITENISKMVNMGVVGALTITLFSAYQFIKLKRQGIATRDALMQVGKQALFSLSLLVVSIAAQGIWGGPAGIIVSVSCGIILISYAVGQSVHQRHFAEKVRVYMIDKSCPRFSN